MLSGLAVPLPGLNAAVVIVMSEKRQSSMSHESGVDVFCLHVYFCQRQPRKVAQSLNRAWFYEKEHIEKSSFYRARRRLYAWFWVVFVLIRVGSYFVFSAGPSGSSHGGLNCSIAQLLWNSRKWII